MYRNMPDQQKRATRKKYLRAQDNVPGATDVATVVSIAIWCVGVTVWGAGVCRGEVVWFDVSASLLGVVWHVEVSGGHFDGC